MITLFGISQCDTIRKARKWLDANNIIYTFHDFRRQGLTTEQVHAWCAELGWEKVLNKRGTTWRQLPEDTKNTVNETSIIELLAAHPTLIKRPILDTGRQRLIGFRETNYQQILLKN
ncbi:ArsC family reductase [Zooshikella harenae]|uniref:ArsC family reductase n=1 Tax=Zooshikella harenae TaxID=2827238 RepID=A0ABS5Z6R4_9GAMM|nr:ArsC family reductase [Zooshikella harenae]MBU2709744.1 ArsC family reductase [Zooshikella harenae]